MYDDQFLGELRVFSFSFPPAGWSQCNGALLSVKQNQPLFSLLGTTYGGDGTNTFALPNLMARTPLHVGNGLNLGAAGGEAQHQLMLNELPAHNHMVTADAIAADATNGEDPATNRIFAASNQTSVYAPAAQVSPMAAGGVTFTGGDGAHENMSPYLTLNVCIAIAGVFPTRS